MADNTLRHWPREYAAAAILLMRAAEFAESEGRSAWDFAVELQDLNRAGLSRADLRRLVCRGWVEHAAELRLAGSGERLFVPTGQLTLRRSSCFILTEAGRAAARQLASTSASPGTPTLSPLMGAGELHGNLADAHSHDPTRGTDSASVPNDLPSHNEAKSLRDSCAAGDANCNTSENTSRMGPSGNGAPLSDIATLKPLWDAELNRLTLGDVVVKEYRTPAPNQQLILAVFEEEGWPPRIDDPLPPHPDQDPKRRLHETIVSLNRNQKNRLIRFTGDGNATGIRWSVFH